MTARAVVVKAAEGGCQGGGGQNSAEDGGIELHSKVGGGMGGVGE